MILMKQAWKPMMAVVLMVVVGAVASTSLAQSSANRAIWMWESQAYDALDDLGTVRGDTLDFIQRRGVDTIYLYADRYDGRNIITDTPQQYHSLLSEVHERGMKAYALLGSAPLESASWTHPDNRGQATTAFQNVLNYNAAAPSDATRFDGINTDIEPWSTGDWWSNNANHLQWYMDTQNSLIQLRDSAAARGDAGADIPVGPALVFWGDGPAGAVAPFQWNGQTKPWSEHVQDLHDYVAFMDFRDTANGRDGNDGPPLDDEGGDGIIGHGRVEAQYARDIGKPVKIGVMLNRAVGEHQKVTFYEEGPQWLERELAIARTAFDAIPGNTFDGFAIQDLLDYQNMVQLHWQQSTDGDWADEANWGRADGQSRPFGDQPGSLDDIHIQPDSGARVTMASGSAPTSVFWLTLGAGTSGVAELDIQDNTLVATRGIVIKNQGRLTGTGTVDADVTIQTGGEVLIAAGESLTITGRISGPGSFTGEGAVVSQSSLSPGLSPGAMTFAGQLEMGPDHELIIELAGNMAGDEYDQLIITGDVALDGVLSVRLLDGFRPRFGDTFTILDVGGSLNGVFDGLVEGSLVGHMDGVDLFITYVGGDGNNVVLTAVPEPTIAGLIVTALVCLTPPWRRSQAVRAG